MGKILPRFLGLAISNESPSAYGSLFLRAADSRVPSFGPGYGLESSRKRPKGRTTSHHFPGESPLYQVVEPHLFDPGIEAHLTEQGVRCHLEIAVDTEMHGGADGVRLEVLFQPTDERDLPSGAPVVLYASS